MYALIVFVAIDYITGVMVAVLEKKLPISKKLRDVLEQINKEEESNDD